MKSICAFASLLLLSVSTPAPAQVATRAVPLPKLGVPFSQPPVVTVEEVLKNGEAAYSKAVQSGTPAASASSSSGSAKQRAAVLQKLTFDRRPSAILKAWSTPLKRPDKKEEPKKNTEPKKELTEEEKKALVEAEKQKKKQEKIQAELDELKFQVLHFKRNVTLADWEKVEGFINSLKGDEPKLVYSQLVQSLVTGPPGQLKTRNGIIIGERNTIRASDVIALAEICPEKKLADQTVMLLGKLVNLCQVEGQAEYIWLEALTEHVKEVPEGQKINRRTAARILIAANRIEEARDFLPPVDEAIKEQDVEALLVQMNLYLRLFRKEREAAMLEESWKAAQALLGLEDLEESQRAQSLRHCVSLVPMLRDELGEAWLQESFTSAPERGMEILSAIGTATAQSMRTQMRNPSERSSILKLQLTAVTSLLKNAPDNATQWQQTMHLMATNWLREATYSGKYDGTSSRGAYMQRDMYGNYFWTNSSSSSRSAPNGMPSPIPSGEVLDTRPGPEWLEFLDDGYRSRFAIETARLHLRVKEEEEAFPYIEQLAETHKDDARDLVQEFIDVWAENHDPNTQSRRTSIYMFSYGFSRRASGIPLTRSRQERNLAELATWADRIRKLPIEDIDERWISAAFIRVHSSAEVYRLDDMEKVFGDIGSMDPKTLAAMLQTMRSNLAGIWRKPEVQQQAKTNRKKKDIEAEVVKGYASAQMLCANGLKDNPDSWRLHLVQAALKHDENDYQASLAATSGYANSRKGALTDFRNAVESYVKTIPDLKETEYSVDTFQFWFNAALGAPDLDQITQDKQPVLSEIPLIKQQLDALPQPAREKHLSMFANNIFTRMSRVNPAVKFRYVREGLNIVGEHETAKEAVKVFQYYNDLVTEIELETALDGNSKVGHDQPFGIFVNLHHTKAIERESGGFAKYLQNQNNGSGYYYNYGRPTENYRDKFEESARDALDEHFEVLSVTFQPESIQSRPAEKQGWRRTSYAYILLQARGPEIDRIPPLKMDLDFMDTTGYAVLPVASQPIQVDCTTRSPALRPIDDISIIQTLDERQSAEGKLILEVKATGHGLIPDLPDLVDLKFADFEVAETEDNGLSVSRFDPEVSEPKIVSDRLWTLTLQDSADSAAVAERTFEFAEPAVEVKEQLWQVYDDADLVEVDKAVVLKESYEESSYSGIYGLIAVTVILSGGAIAWLMIRKPDASGAQVVGVELPDDLTPFNVLNLLRQIESNNGFSAEEKSELAGSIAAIERFYFATESEEPAPDLKAVASTWVKAAGGIPAVAAS